MTNSSTNPDQQANAQASIDSLSEESLSEESLSEESLSEESFVVEAMESTSLDANADLETVLTAWHAATLRLEQTHNALRDEVRRLTDELDAKNRQLTRKNRLADLGRMASHIAHEVRNSLVPISLYLSLLRRRVSEDSGSLDIIGKVDSGMTTLEATVNDLLHFTSEREPHRVTVVIRDLIDEVILSLAPQLAAQAIDADIDVPGEIRILADENMLRRAVLNLVLNALDVMPDGGELVITAVESPAAIELEIADSGPGLPENARRNVFEPFFTTKSGGTGLGLSIVQRIADAHGGEVTACNCPEGGAAFTIRFVKSAMEAAA